MAYLTITVPADLVDDLRRELRGTLAERAAALRRALDDIEGTLVELRDLDHALAQLAGPPGPVPLTAHPEVLADALRALLDTRPTDVTLLELVRTVEWGSH
jgi:hypothetical protein